MRLPGDKRIAWVRVGEGPHREASGTTELGKTQDDIDAVDWGTADSHSPPDVFRDEK